MFGQYGVVLGARLRQPWSECSNKPVAMCRRVKAIVSASTKSDWFWPPGVILEKGLTMPAWITLFLALPVSWKGSLVQYAGRLHRLHPPLLH